MNPSLFECFIGRFANPLVISYDFPKLSAFSYIDPKPINKYGNRPAIVSDNVISEFKLNVVKREGDTLGDFSSASEQAMQLWINTQPGNEQSADLRLQQYQTIQFRNSSYK